MMAEGRIKELEMENEALRADIKRLSIENGDSDMILDLPVNNKDELNSMCIRLLIFLKKQEQKSIDNRTHIIEFMKLNGFQIPEEFFREDSSIGVESTIVSNSKAKANNLLNSHLLNVRNSLLKVRLNLTTSKE